MPIAWNEPKPIQPPPVNAPAGVDEALRRIEADREREAAEEQAEQERAWDRYVALLSKAEGELTEDDIRELGYVVSDLGITREQAAADKQTLAKARGLEQLAAQADEAKEAHIAARAVILPMQKRHEEELWEARKKSNSAQYHLSNCTDAPRKLEMLRRERPQLFKSGHKVILRSN